METLDQQLFQLINQSLSNPLFDWLMPFVTDLHKQKIFLYVFAIPGILFWIYRGKQRALACLIGLSLCIGLVDNFTYRILKPTFKRERPPAVESSIQLRTNKYAGYSFPSNHAANNFAGATFLSYCYPALYPIFFTVAALVAYSRVYVGVHYPFDILGGALFGAIFGLFFFRFWAIILEGIGRIRPSLAITPRGRHGIKDEEKTSGN